MKKQTRHRFFALLLAIVACVPTSIQVVHALENHEHVVCTAQNVKHIHEQSDDCSVYHTIIDNNFLFVENYNNTILQKTYFASYDLAPQIHSLGFVKLGSPRAPPIFS